MSKLNREISSDGKFHKIIDQEKYKYDKNIYNFFKSESYKFIFNNTKQYKFYYLIIFITLSVSSFLFGLNILILSKYVKFIIDDNLHNFLSFSFQNYNFDFSNYLDEYSNLFLNLIFITLIFIGIFSNFLLEYFATSKSMMINKRFILSLREKYTKKITSKSEAFFKEDRIADMIYISSSIMNRLSSIVPLTTQGLSIILKFLILFLALMYYSLSLTIIIIVLFIGILFFVKYFSKKFDNLSSKANEISSIQQSFFKELIEIVSLLRQSIPKEKEYINEYLNITNSREDILINQRKIGIIFKSFLIFIIFLLLIFLSFCLKYQLLFNIVYSSEFYISYILLCLPFAYFGNNIMNYRFLLSSLLPQIEIIRQFLNDDINENKNELIFDKTIKVEKVVTIIDKIFYGNKVILSNINLSFNIGNSYFIFGKSGIGKSSLLECISGRNHEYSGSILINDIDIKDYNLEKSSDTIGLSSQNDLLINSSIKDNITFFNPNLENNEINNILSESNIDFIKGNLNLESRIGNRGAKISAGQKQRLLISRILAKDSDILIFDETTNSIDNKNEDKVIKNILSRKKNKIIIFTSHNKEIIRLFDKVIFIDNGKIDECDTHDNLMRNNINYKRLFEKN